MILIILFSHYKTFVFFVQQYNRRLFPKMENKKTKAKHYYKVNKEKLQERYYKVLQKSLWKREIKKEITQQKNIYIR